MADSSFIFIHFCNPSAHPESNGSVRRSAADLQSPSGSHTHRLCVILSLSYCLSDRMKNIPTSRKNSFFLFLKEKLKANDYLIGWVCKFDLGHSSFLYLFFPGVAFAAKQFGCMLSERDYQTVSPARGLWWIVERGAWIFIGFNIRATQCLFRLI